MRIQYKIKDKDSLYNILLSPSVYVKDEAYMACKSCQKYALYSSGDNTPKFAICNEWLIGEIPRPVVGHDIGYILAAVVAKVRIFVNIF